MVKYTNHSNITAFIVDRDARPNPYSMGYGRKIPTRYRLTFRDGITRRVYVMQYANAGSAYVVYRGEELFIDTETQWRLEDTAAKRASGICAVGE